MQQAVRGNGTALVALVTGKERLGGRLVLLAVKIGSAEPVIGIRRQWIVRMAFDEIPEPGFRIGQVIAHKALVRGIINAARVSAAK